MCWQSQQLELVSDNGLIEQGVALTIGGTKAVCEPTSAWNQHHSWNTMSKNLQIFFRALTLIWNQYPSPLSITWLWWRPPRPLSRSPSQRCSASERWTPACPSPPDEENDDDEDVDNESIFCCCHKVWQEEAVWSGPLCHKHQQHPHHYHKTWSSSLSMFWPIMVAFTVDKTLNWVPRVGIFSHTWRDQVEQGELKMINYKPEAGSCGSSCPCSAWPTPWPAPWSSRWRRPMPSRRLSAHALCLSHRGSARWDTVVRKPN